MNRLGQADLNLLAAVDDTLGDPLGGAAIVRGDDDVLCHVGQFSGKVSGVGRLQCRVGQSFSSTVGGAEVLQHAQAFAEIRLDGRLDDLARRLRHQSPHPGQLANLLDATPGTGVGHQEDRVDVAGEALIAFQLLHHFGGDLFAGVGPGVEHLVVAFTFGDDAALVELVDSQHGALGRADDLRFVGRRDQVVGGEGEPAPGTLAESDLVHVVQQVDRCPATQDLVAVGDHGCQLRGSHGQVVVGHARRQHGVEDHAAHGGFDERAGRGARVALHHPTDRQPYLDARVRVHDPQGVSSWTSSMEEKVMPSPFRSGRAMVR